MKMAKPFSLTKAPREFKLVYPALSNTSSDFDPTSTVAQSYRAIGESITNARSNGNP